MELWKVHKFCETASLQQLRDTEKELLELRKQGTTHNFDVILNIVRESIRLREMFEDR